MLSSENYKKICALETSELIEKLGLYSEVSTLIENAIDELDDGEAFNLLND